MNRRAAIAVVLGIQLVLGLLLSEGLIRLIYQRPAKWYPAAVRKFLAWEYFYRRSIIQVDERFARYDPELLYTLKPGTFTFSNVEFATPYTVNSLGVRDDEASLAGPEIVVAGDSYAMGWGVRQDEDFPQVIERRTGRRVLNTAVSSYGTVREMLMVDRVDLSHASTLIIQYCSNDYPENEEFQKHGNHHVPSSREVWRQAAFQPRRVPKFWPLPMVYSAATWIKRGVEGRQRGNEAWPFDPETAARLFLNALMHAPKHGLSALRIIVTDMDPDPAFIRALDRIHKAAEYPPDIQALTVVDISSLLTPDQYYVLDDHFRASAHAAIADALIAVLLK